MQIYIVAVLISLLLIAILFFALRSTVKRIDYNTKKYFVDKLQDYDYLIEEKKKKIDELNNEIEQNKKELSELKKIGAFEPEEETKVYYNDFTIPKYEDQSLFKKYKDIKEKFSLDYEKIVSNFINNKLTVDNTNYKSALEIRKKFTDDVVYKIMGLRLEEQKKYIKEFLSDEEYKLVSKLINLNKIKINRFITSLDIFIEKNDPTVYVYVGQKNKNFDYLSDKIKTIYDKSINEGIKINYKGIIYDYSI